MNVKWYCAGHIPVGSIAHLSPQNKWACNEPACLADAVFKVVTEDDPSAQHTSGYEYVKDFYDSSFDPGDQWGSVMGFFFALSHTLYHADGEIPSEWMYVHGLCFEFPDPDEYMEEYLYDLLNDGMATTDDLTEFGRYLEEESIRLQDEGKDY